MTKPGLGRGLDRLMNGDQVAGRAGHGGDNGQANGGTGADNGAGAAKPSAHAPSKSAADTAPIGKGLNTLLAAGESRGPMVSGANFPNRSNPRALGAKPAALPEPKLLLPAWFFFSADVLLLAFCVAVCFDAPKPLDLGHILFCAVSVGLGALLAIVGVLKSE